LIMPNRHGNSTTFESTIWTCIDSAQVHMIYIYIYLYIHMYKCTYIRTLRYILIYARTHTHIYRHICTYTYVYIRKSLCMFTHAHIYIYIFTFTCAFACTFTIHCIALHYITLRVALRWVTLHDRTQAHRHTHIYI
jgi:hypothetical protein